MYRPMGTLLILFVKKGAEVIKGCICALLCLVFLPAASIHAEEPYVTSYKCFDTKGCERYSASASITRVPDRGPDRYALTEKGAGVLNGFSGRVSWEARLEFESTDDLVKPLSMENRVFAADGELLTIEREEFDYAAHKVRCSSKDVCRKKEKQAEFVFDGDIVNRMALALYVEKFLLRGQRERSLTLLSGEPRLYKVGIKVVKKEDVVINGVKKEALQLRLDPDLGILNFAKAVMPEAYVWHAAVPKFEWLKYRGLENSLGSPIVEIISGDVK